MKMPRKVQGDYKTTLQINKPKLLIVKGKDEELFFDKLLRQQQIESVVHKPSKRP